jgi:N,N'-diacetyllegionaminate synthase
MMIDALIPARSGSKRLPNKHTRLLAGSALIDWTLAAAKQSACFRRICLSTDDPYLQSRAQAFHCNPFPLRPTELCGDHVPSAAVLQHYLDSLQDVGESLPECVVLLQPTSPFRGAHRIREAIELAKGDALLSVGPVWKPSQWNRSEGADGTQIPSAAFSSCLNGAIYLISVERFLASGELMPPNPQLFHMHAWESIDVDGPLDWLLAQSIAQHLDPKGHFLEDGVFASGPPCTLPKQEAPTVAHKDVQTLTNSASPFVIAEIGVNHDGSKEKAIELIRMAARCGADAVKFQLFKAETLARQNAPMAIYQTENLQERSGQQEMLRKLEIDLTSLRVCKQVAHDLGLQFLCTPFDLDSLDALVELGVDAIKISSGDANHILLLEKAALAPCPVVVSTGMCNWDDVHRIQQIFKMEPQKLALLHCVSAYPAPLEQSNLRVLDLLKSRGVHYGFSDHTLGADAALAAVALGARILEKHITLDTSARGPDHAASMNEHAFRDYIRSVQGLATAMGDAQKRCMLSEEDVARVARKSIVMKRDCPAGHVLCKDDFLFLRPADGLSVDRIDQVLGQRLNQKQSAGSLLELDDLQRELR